MKIGLFIPCYVDAVYPEAGIATYKLLKHLGLEVEYPERQTCCGQPMANAGFEDMATPLARKFNDLFSPYDYVVMPSASCAAFVRNFHPRLLKGEDHVCTVPERAMDIVEFLHDVIKVKSLPGDFPHIVSVHNSCHGVREIGLSAPSERHLPPYNKIIDLLQLKQGITIRQPERPDECCGFGGMFMWILFVIIIGIVAYFIIQNSKTKSAGGTTQETPLDILKKRYAKGEITKEEYERMKKDVE